MATKRLTTDRFVETYSGADRNYSLEDVAEAAANVSDNPDLVFVAADFLNCLEAFKDALKDVKFEV